MREINTSVITEAVRNAFIAANTELPEAVKRKLMLAKESETNEKAKHILGLCLENAAVAKERKIPICQDTGLPVVFIDVGQDVHIVGDNLCDAINDGVREAYVGGNLRLSCVRDPLYDRTNTETGGPAVIHTNIVSGENIKIVVIPKGFGAENTSFLRMFEPSASEDDIVTYIADMLQKSGSNPCPPTVIGVGIGGDFEYCAYLSKLALTENPDESNPDERYARLEKKILDAINAKGIGPQGFGGSTSALAVKILTSPTHIAGLPVAVNVSCHVTRSFEVIL